MYIYVYMCQFEYSRDDFRFRVGRLWRWGNFIWQEEEEAGD